MAFYEFLVAPRWLTRPLGWPPGRSGTGRETPGPENQYSRFGRIWQDLGWSDTGIRDNSVPSAPPCPQTPKLPNHQ